ncbi:MAG TPA: hypothetical protein VEP50_13710 [bacterium]|nr:hypothetical protein [bacterium]
MSSRVNHQEIVKKALDAKAVDFAAIGKVIAEVGPALALADDPGDFFCGTMRHFVHVYSVRVVNDGSAVEELGALGRVAAELRS